MADIHYEKHHDDEWVDEVRISTVPRYKTSGLSGDEWRVSAKIELYRKGVLVAEPLSTSTVEQAVMALGGYWQSGTSEYADRVYEATKHKCMQPGCASDAISEFRLKKLYTRSEGIERPTFGTEYRRKFCRRHLRRGDCGIEDSDDNYQIVSGPGPDDAEMRASDESPSVFGGTIDLRKTS